MPGSAGRRGKHKICVKQAAILHILSEILFVKYDNKSGCNVVLYLINQSGL